METERTYFRLCSSCKRELPFQAPYYTCSVSTCNRKRMGLTFCSVACFEAHVPMIRHREAWAEEQRAPSRGYIAENKSFHDAVIRASGNETLGVITNQLQLPLLMFQLNKMLTADNIAASLAEHRAIARAMLDRDAEAAESCMRAHLERARLVASEMPSQVFRNDPRSRPRTS